MIKECLLCGSDRFTTLLECTDHMVSKRVFPVAQCDICGFRITVNAPESPDISTYYESEEYLSHTSSPGITGTMYRLARTIALKGKARIVKRAASTLSGSVLDIGAGTGHFLKEMADRGWEVEGVEVSSRARKAARIINGLELRECFSSNNYRTASYDVVTLWHVLEHIHTPKEYLSLISDIIKPGGVLIIALPNPDSIDAKHYKEEWAAWDVPRHLWHFSQNDIEKLAAMYGFTFKGKRRMPFDAFYISILSEKYGNKRFSLIRGMTKGFLFYIASLLHKRKSSSLVYLFEK